MINIFSSYNKNNTDNKNINNVEQKNDGNKNDTNIPSNSIFITQEEARGGHDITRKLTYTDIYSTIPDTNIITPADADVWKKNKLVEWRWRFININSKRLAEISYLRYDIDKRMYQSKSGQWVHRIVPDEINKYVVEQYYFYTDA